MLSDRIRIRNGWLTKPIVTPKPKPSRSPKPKPAPKPSTGIIKMKKKSRGKPSTLERVHGITVEGHDWNAWCELAAKQGVSTAEWLRRAGQEAAARGGVEPKRPPPPPPRPPVFSTPAKPGRIDPGDVCKWLAVNLRRERTKRLLLDRDVSRRTGIGHLSVIRLQAGTQAPSFKALINLANAVGVTPAALLTQPQDMSLLDEDGRNWNGISQKLQREKERLAKMPVEKRALAEMEESLGFRFDD